MQFEEQLKQDGFVDERNLWVTAMIKNNAGLWFGAIGAGIASISKTRLISIKGSTLYLLKPEKKGLKQVNQFELNELKKFQVKNAFFGIEYSLKLETIDFKESYSVNARKKVLKEMASLINQ
jgi:cobalamin-dependent methionine synthase I